MKTRDKQRAESEARSLALARLAAGICDGNRAEEIALLDMRPVCDFADFFLIASAASKPQMKAIVREVGRAMKAAHAQQLGLSGVSEGRWVLLDYGDLVIHLFDPETREFYQIEHLWGDAKRIAL